VPWLPGGRREPDVVLGSPYDREGQLRYAGGVRFGLIAAERARLRGVLERVQESRSGRSRVLAGLEPGARPTPSPPRTTPRGQLSRSRAAAGAAPGRTRTGHPLTFSWSQAGATAEPQLNAAGREPRERLTRDVIMDLLTAMPERTWSPAEVANALDELGYEGKQDSVRVMLQRLYKAGALERPRHGHYKVSAPNDGGGGHAPGSDEE
jgi:hypothetical protein